MEDGREIVIQIVYSGKDNKAASPQFMDAIPPHAQPTFRVTGVGATHTLGAKTLIKVSFLTLRNT